MSLSILLSHSGFSQLKGGVPLLSPNGEIHTVYGDNTSGQLTRRAWITTVPIVAQVTMTGMGVFTGWAHLGGYTYVGKVGGTGNRLFILDTTTDTNLSLAGTHNITSTPHDIVPLGSSHLLIGMGNDSAIRVYSVSTPSAPTLVSTLTDATFLQGCDAVAMKSGSSTVGAALAHDGHYLTTLNLSNLAAPVRYGSLSHAWITATPTMSYGSDGIVVIATASGLLIVDATTPASPTLLHSTTTWKSALAAVGLISAVHYDAATKRVFLTNTPTPNGFVLLDLTTPTAPTLIDSVAYASMVMTTVSGGRWFGYGPGGGAEIGVPGVGGGRWVVGSVVIK